MAASFSKGAATGIAEAERTALHARTGQSMPEFDSADRAFGKARKLNAMR